MQKKNDKAVIAFYDGQKRILLQDRHGISKAGEEWGFFGGSLEKSETAEQALRREIKEELDFDLKEFAFLATYRIVLPTADLYNEIQLFIGPLCVTQKLQQKEGRGMQWFTIPEARELIMNRPDTNPIDHIEKYLNAK